MRYQMLLPAHHCKPRRARLGLLLSRRIGALPAMEHRVLLVIDVQAGVGHEPTRPTRFETPEGSLFRTLKGVVRFAPGMPETELAFAPRADARVFVKTGYSAATPEVLAAAREAGSRIYLCGIATDNCVLATAPALFAAGG